MATIKPTTNPASDATRRADKDNRPAAFDVWVGVPPDFVVEPEAVVR